QELLLRILHLREDLARGCRTDAVDRVCIDGPLPVYCHEVRDLLRTGEEFSFFVGEIQLSCSLCKRVSNGPCRPPEHSKEARLAVRAFRMVRHLSDADLLVEVPAFEAQQVHRLGREVESHPIQDLLSLCLRREEFGRL